jgi:hypothetical protein
VSNDTNGNETDRWSAAAARIGLFDGMYMQLMTSAMLTATIDHLVNIGLLSDEDRRQIRELASRIYGSLRRAAEPK